MVLNTMNATCGDDSIVADATKMQSLTYPAFKGRAKVMPTLCVEAQIRERLRRFGVARLVEDASPRENSMPDPNSRCADVVTLNGNRYSGMTHRSNTSESFCLA